jgi:hypothetical protein
VFLHNQASFSLLFQRGKYRSYVPSGDTDAEDSEKEREEKRREIERFLTTAIGFCIRYDPTFRSHFLTAICNVPKDLAATPVDILVEPFHWGDLVLISRKGDFACVVECKVHANLQKWQNPEAKGFERVGYGKSILREFKTQKIIRYIVLGWEEPLTFPKGTRIKYAQKLWRHLEQGFPRHRALATDLYACVSALGVPAFILKKSQTMKLGNNTKVLTQALTLLPAAQIEAELDETWPKFDCWADQSWWNFGVNVKRTRKTKTARGKLQKFVNPQKGRPIAWYGYEGKLEENNGHFLSFWFHCANAKAQKNVADRLLKNGINRSYIKLGEDDAPFHVIIRAPLDVATKEGLSGDRSWFSKILKAAMRAN